MSFFVVLTFILFEEDSIDTLWFHKLREFLVMSNQRKVLTLRILCQEVYPLMQVYLFSTNFSSM